MCLGGSLHVSRRKSISFKISPGGFRKNWGKVAHNLSAALVRTAVLWPTRQLVLELQDSLNVPTMELR